MMTSHNDYSRAAGAYGIAHGQGMTKMQVLLELYLGLSRFLAQMQQEHQDGNRERYFHLQERTIALLIAMQGALPAQNGTRSGKTADLDRFYTALYAQVRHAHEHSDPAHILTQARQAVVDVHQHWHRLYHKHPELFIGTGADGMA